MPECAARRRQRFARAALLSGLATLLALNAGLLMAVELVPRLRDPFYGDKARRLKQRIAAAPRPLTIIMLGSSRTGVGFHARLAEEVLTRELAHPVVAFNFGSPSAGPVTNLLYLRRLLADGVRPDFILIEVMPPFLAAQRTDPFERSGFASYRLQPGELEIVAHYGFPVAEVRPDWWAAERNPFYGLREPLLDRFLPAALPHTRRSNWGRATDEGGWNAVPWGPPPAAEMQARIGRGHTLYGETLARLKVGGGPAAALRDLVALCGSEHISARLVLMPEGSWYRSWYGPRAEAELQTFLGALRAEFGVNVVDARTWVADADYSDSHHLLKSGAASFTRRLTRECLLSWLRGEPAGGTDALRE